MGHESKMTRDHPPPWRWRQPRSFIQEQKSGLTMTAGGTKDTPPTMASSDASFPNIDIERVEDIPLKEVNVDLLSPLSVQAIDLDKIECQRRSNKSQKGDKEEENGDENDWNKHPSETSGIAEVEVSQEGKFTTVLSELPDKGKEVLKIAACLGSWETRLLQAATSLSEGQLLIYLETIAAKNIIKDVNGIYEFASDDAEKESYSLIPPDKRKSLHLSIGRKLIQNLSHDELEYHMYHVLLQFHCCMDGITSETERNAIAVLCLRATHVAVAKSDFRAAYNYAEFGVLLLGRNCWKNDYDLSLALYNASAEMSHCVSNYERVDEMVEAVVENATCFRDTLRVRAARVHSLSSTYRMVEALDEGLDVLKHLGERFPSKPRKYQVFIEFVRTKRLLRGKTNESILRMPHMENQDKIAAMQMLNLIFPNSFHVNPLLFILIAFRILRLTVRYGLSAVSAVGFAAYSSMLATYHTNKDEGYRYSDLALELIGQFKAKQHIPRVYFFLYSETMAHKYDLRTLCTHLYRAYQVGLETGDIEFALVDANMCFGYMMLSGQSLESVEEKTREFYETAVTYKQEFTLGTMRPALKCLNILMGKLERPTGFAFESDLARATEAKDEAAVWIIHFMQLMLSYLFGDYESAAQEADYMEAMLKLHLHPGFSSIIVAYCLAYLAVANRRRGRDRRQLLSKANGGMKTLEKFSKYIPENSLHKLSLVEAELAVVNGDNAIARGKYLIAISVSAELDDQAMRAVACERFAIFLQSNERDGTTTARRFREAHEAYKRWGASAKVEQMEKEMPELLSPESSIIVL